MTVWQRRDADFDSGFRLFEAKRFEESTQFFYKAYKLTRDLSEAANNNNEDDVLTLMRWYALSLFLAGKWEESASVYIELLGRADEFGWMPKQAEDWQLEGCFIITRVLESSDQGKAFEYVLKGIEISINYKHDSVDSEYRLKSFIQATNLLFENRKYEEMHETILRGIRLSKHLINGSVEIFRDDILELVGLFDEMNDLLEKTALSTGNLGERIILIKTVNQNLTDMAVLSPQIFENRHPEMRLRDAQRYLYLGRAYQDSGNAILGLKNYEIAYQMLIEMKDKIESMEESSKSHFQQTLALVCLNIIPHLMDWNNVENLGVDVRWRLVDLFAKVVDNFGDKNSGELISMYLGLSECALSVGQDKLAKMALDRLMPIFSRHGKDIESVTNLIMIGMKINRLKLRLGYASEE